MREKFTSRYLTDDDIERTAQVFLKKHTRYATVPIDIDGIVQFDLHMDIIPIHDLKATSTRLGLDIDAFISADFKSITVDEFIMMKRETRYRFSLSHEIGHMVLHKKIYSDFQFNSSSDWFEFVKSIWEKWKPFEYQANNFAGRLLVPRNELLQRYPAAAKQAGIDILEEYPGLDDFPELYADMLKKTTTDLLAKEFSVSPPAMKTRLDKERSMLNQ